MNEENNNILSLYCLGNECKYICFLNPDCNYNDVIITYTNELKKILLNEGKICNNCKLYLRRQLRLLRFKSIINNQCYNDIWELEKKVEFLFNNSIID